MYFRANKKNTNTVSLNDSIGFDKDGNEITLADVIKEESDEVSDALYLKENLESLKEYIGCLNKREKDVIIKRYGLLGVKVQTQKEIASELNISRSYVSRIEKRALVKMLREFIKNNKV